MKSILQHELNKLPRIWPLIVLAFIVFSFGPSWLEAYNRAQIVDQPFSSFLDYQQFRVANYCIDDPLHQGFAVREVKQTQTGWPATIVTEIGVRTNGAWGKIGEAYPQEVFYEVLDNSRGNTKTLYLETHTHKEGTYRYEVYIELDLPYNVTKNRPTPLYSNPFIVKDCSDMTEEEREQFTSLTIEI